MGVWVLSKKFEKGLAFLFIRVVFIISELFLHRLNDSFEMMHTSPDLFSQSLSRAKVIRSDMPYLYSDSNRNEPDAPSVINQHKSENRFVQNDEQAIIFFIQHPAMQTAPLNVYTDCVRRPEFHRCYPTLEDLVHTMSRKLVH